VSATPRTRTVTLTHESPVRISEDDWLVLAETSLDVSGVRATMKVRRHADGRVLVYGTLFRGRENLARAGYLLVADADPMAIADIVSETVEDLVPLREVLETDLDWDRLERDCIAALPAVTI
jgi:hypothetical protein